MPTEHRLRTYGGKWLDAAAIAEAHRVRVRRAVLAEIAAGMTPLEASRLTGVSRVTINAWQRAERAGRT